jgi:hypothetical protein
MAGKGKTPDYGWTYGHDFHDAHTNHTFYCMDIWIMGHMRLSNLHSCTYLRAVQMTKRWLMTATNCSCCLSMGMAVEGVVSSPLTFSSQVVSQVASSGIASVGIVLSLGGKKCIQLMI